MNFNFRKIFQIGGIALAVLVLALGGGFLGSRLTGKLAPNNYVPAGLTYGVLSADDMDSPMRSEITNDDVSLAIQDRFRSVANTTLPVVVEINVVNTVTQSAGASPFNFFFGNPNQEQQQPRQFSQQGLGSGVIVARDGETVYVLTNNHVAGEADEIEVVLDDGRSYEAELVGTDKLMDLALVSFLTTDQLPIAVLGDSDSLSVGDWVFAVGNPLGYHSTLTTGVVSAKSRDAKPGSGMNSITSFIQTDAAINQGNSGGALVNLNGEVVGINTWIASQNGGNIGLGFAIPINDAKRAISDFIDSGSVTYSWLGVQTGLPGPDLAEDLRIDDTNGAFVFGVYEDSPAGKSGVQPGDLITRVGNVEIADSNGLVRTIAGLKVGDPTDFVVIRDGRSEELMVKTERRSETSGSDTANLWPGINVTPITDEIRTQLSVDRGDDGIVIVAVNADSITGTGGLQQGDIITAVNGTPIRTAQDFYNEIGQETDEVQFKILRAGRGLTIGFDRPKA